MLEVRIVSLLDIKGDAGEPVWVNSMCEPVNIFGVIIKIRSTALIHQTMG